MRMETQRQYLQFYLQKESVFLPLDAVKMVLALPALQSVPNQLQAFCGMLNFHGQGIAVYDLVHLLDQTSRIKMTPDIPLLLIYTNQELIGFLVTETVGLVKITEDMKQSPTTEMMPYVLHIVESENLTGWILNPDQLVTHCNLILNMETKHE